MAYMRDHYPETIMEYFIRLKVSFMIGITFSFVLSVSSLAQTFSPYTASQIQEFNSQAIAPIETPAGPVYIETPAISQGPKTSFDSRYIKNPDGEEQAEGQSAESTVPFKPIPATLTF
jgi:hypothetical protein